MKKTTLNKKTIVQTTTDSSNNDAILLIKKAIANSRESYKDFIAGGVFLLIHDAGGRDSLNKIIKNEYNDSEWESVRRGWIRKVNACVTLATYRVELLKNKTTQEIRDWLTQNNMTAATIESIESMHKNQKNKTTTPNPVKTPTLPRVPDSDFKEGVESTDANGDSDVKKAWDAIATLTAKERLQLIQYAESQGYRLTFEKIKSQPVKIACNLYG